MTKDGWIVGFCIVVMVGILASTVAPSLGSFHNPIHNMTAKAAAYSKGGR